MRGLLRRRAVIAGLAALPLLGPGRATAQTPGTGYPLTISGSGQFVEAVVAALEQMQTVDGAAWALVLGHVRGIQEGERNYSWSNSRVIEIASESALHSSCYAGSIILHEAVHVQRWREGLEPNYGCAGEAIALQAQADYLRRCGDPEQAAWIESQIGTWC